MYKTFIFDLDGTLLDTLQDLANSVNYALRQNGMPEHAIDDIRRFVGNGVRLLMERAVPDGARNPRFEAAFAAFRQHYMQHSLDTTRPYDGIPELIRELKARGCQMAVVSNKMMAATQELVSHFFPEIDVAIGEHEAAGIKKKPAPDTVYEALRQLAVSDWQLAVSDEPTANSQRPTANSQRPTSNTQHPAPNTQRPTAVYVGDSDVDIMTARNAGLPCISVLWGFRDRDFLLAHGATAFAERPADILNNKNDIYQ